MRDSRLLLGAGRQGFTLVEMLTSLVVLALMMLVLGSLTSGTSKIWRDTTGKIGAFQNARAAFETLTQNLSQATLNTYYDYYDSTGARNTSAGSTTFDPTDYGRYSDLHFISAPASQVLAGINRKNKDASTQAYPTITSGHAVFFQATTGYTQQTTAKNLDNTLNAIGYFVEFGSDKDFMPPLISGITPHYRYRLVQLMQPAESLDVYKESWTAHIKGAKANWFKTPLELTVAAATSPRPTQTLAENVILIVLRPKISDQEYANTASPVPIAPNYSYDSQPQAVIPPSQLAQFPSRYQLPPLIAVTLVAIDEASASRLETKYGTTPPLIALGLSNLFQTTADTNVPMDYDKDLQTLKTKLVEAKVNFRVFETDLAIRASKWSQK